LSPTAEATTTALRKTALNRVHRQMGAKMVDFGGWDMPIEYPGFGLVKEHMAVRTGVGVFDVSHMGDIVLRSTDNPGQALAAVQHISMNDAARFAIGQAHYSALLYPQGTFVDDVIVHRLGPEEYLLVINAGTREKDVDWVRENTRDFACEVLDAGDQYTQIAIQGPRAGDVLSKLADADLSAIKNYWFTTACVCGLPGVMVARTGYTGEDGFEIYVSSDETSSEYVWNQVLEAGKEFSIAPCGLGARNTLRLEAKMALYGHEISESITVWEAGLDRFCKMEKGEFIGRAALEKQKAEGIERTLVGLEMMERGIARDGHKVHDEDGAEMGYVTSGSPAPFLKKNIALAYLPPKFSALGTSVWVDVRGKRVRAEVVPTPFYKRPKK
jgi:aminomethyltransferase